LLRFEYQDAMEERMRSRLYDLATRDGLTNTFNRRYFTEHLAAEWAWAQRHDKPCAVLTVDVDRFKRVNDTYGHPAGDQVLRRLAQVVLATIRKEDLFARVGGEEFSLLSRDTGADEATVIGERLRSAVEHSTFVWDGKRLAITISAGGATSADSDVQTPEDLLGKADEMLYRAKNAGRNRVMIAGT
jgi:diguanylate cyclase (GGDEF)-like protein